MRPGRGHLAGQCKAIEHTGHLHVREQHGNLGLFRPEKLVSCVAVVSIENAKARLFQDVHGIHANDQIVVHNEGIGSIWNR